MFNNRDGTQIWLIYLSFVKIHEISSQSVIYTTELGTAFSIFIVIMNMQISELVYGYWIFQAQMYPSIGMKRKLFIISSSVSINTASSSCC